MPAARGLPGSPAGRPCPGDRCPDLPREGPAGATTARIFCGKALPGRPPPGFSAGKPCHGDHRTDFPREGPATATTARIFCGRRPDLHLPRDFADRFFLRDTGDRKPSIPELERSILRLRDRLKKQEDLLARLLEEEEEEIRLREEAEVRAAEEELLALERKHAEAAARVEAVKARLGNRKKAR